MGSVVGFAKQFDYKIDIKLLEEAYEITDLGDVEIVGNNDIDAGGIGSVVDALTRYLLGGNMRECFVKLKNSVTRVGKTYLVKECKRILFQCNKNERKISDQMILSFFKFTAGEGIDRSGKTSAEVIKQIQQCSKLTRRHFDEVTQLVNRCLNFLRSERTITQIGVFYTHEYFKNNLYVRSGDGDFLTDLGYLDLKVSTQRELSPKHICQIICYGLLYVLHETPDSQQIATTIKYLEIYNPRLNIIHTFDVSKISPTVIEQVKGEILGYKRPV